MASAAEGRPQPPAVFKRSLRTIDLVSIGVGGVIGAGIFVLTGVAAAEYAGPAISLSYIISAVTCGFSALCYSELASMVPSAGSAYAYATATMGELPGFLIGWDLCLEYLFGAATVAVGWSSYVRSALRDAGVVLPPAIAQAPWAFDVHTATWRRTDGLFDAPAVVVVVLAVALQVRGMSHTSRVNNAMVLLKLIVLALFITLGSFYVKPANYVPFLPENTGEFGVFGWSGVLRGSSVVFFSFIGFDALSCNAGEAINPQVTVPRATIITLVLCTALYVATSLVMTGLASYTTLGVADPIAVAVDAAPALMWLRPLVKGGAIAGLSSVVLVQILGQARIFFAMASDGALPRVFARVHKEWGTPHVATCFTGLCCAVIAGLVPVTILGELVSIGTLFAFALVCAGVLVLRRTQPALHRPFRTPWVPAVPVAGIATSVVQMAALPVGTWLRFLVWLALGLAVYFLYSRSRMTPYETRRAALLGLSDERTPSLEGEPQLVADWVSEGGPYAGAAASAFAPRGSHPS
jgi:APA family basic amino acid/polyamine antiporter